MMRPGGGMGGMGGGMGRGGAMRSLIRDQSVLSTKVPKGTARRIVRCLAPYRGRLAAFFLLTVVDSSIGVANPLIYRAIIDQGILGHNSTLIVVLALIIGGLAIADAALALAEQYFSARVGEGLIYDMRSQVFAHIQRMPLAFFTRTQTGALISRLNNDVHRRPAGVHRHPLVVGSATSSASCWCSSSCSSCPGRSPWSASSSCPSSSSRRAHRAPAVGSSPESPTRSTPR